MARDVRKLLGTEHSFERDCKKENWENFQIKHRNSPKVRKSRKSNGFCEIQRVSVHTHH